MVHPIFYMLPFILVAEFCSFAGAQGIGVSYSRFELNLPPARKSVELCKSHNIQRIHLYKPDRALLHHLRNTGIQVLLGVSNDDIQSIAYNPRFAKVWVRRNVVWHAPFINFRCIIVGDHWNDNLTSHLLPAMKSLQLTLNFFNLSIAVTTTMSYNAVSTPNPPSNGYFDNTTLELLSPILEFLFNYRYPLLYPVKDYFRYTTDDYSETSLPFALLNTTEPEISDGDYVYSNLLDALVDSVYFAIEKTGVPDVEIIVTETGWPVNFNFPDRLEIIENAQTHNNNLVTRLRSNHGTPKRPGRPLESYMFQLYRNDSFYTLNPAVDRYGLFNPNMTQLYPLDFWYIPPK